MSFEPAVTTKKPALSEGESGLLKIQEESLRDADYSCFWRSNIRGHALLDSLAHIKAFDLANMRCVCMPLQRHDFKPNSSPYRVLSVFLLDDRPLAWPGLNLSKEYRNYRLVSIDTEFPSPHIKIPISRRSAFLPGTQTFYFGNNPSLLAIKHFQALRQSPFS